MAYSLDDEKNKTAQQEGDLDTDQSLPSTAAAPGAGPGASTGKAPTPQSAPAQPFQNLQAYLGANKSQVQEQGDRLSGTLNDQYGQIEGDINQAKTDFGNQVKSGYAQNDPNIVNQAVSNPTQFASDPNNVKAFQSLYNDTYSGPANFEGSDTYGNLSGKVSKASSDAELLKNNAGIQNYYQSQNPNATKGGNILDSVLLQGNPEAYGKVKEAANKFPTLQDYLGTTVTGLNQNITDAQGQAQEISAGLRNQFTGEGGVIPGFQKDLTDRLSQAKAGALERDRAINSSLVPSAYGTIPTETILEGLGMTPQEFNKLNGGLNDIYDYRNIPIGTDRSFSGYQDDNPLASFLGDRGTTAQDINLGNFASLSDYQKSEALSKLTGEDDLASFLDPNNINQAGTAKTGYPTFNKEGAMEKVDSLVKTNDVNYLNTLMGQNLTESQLKDLAKQPGNQIKALFSNKPSDYIQTTPYLKKALESLKRLGINV